MRLRVPTASPSPLAARRAKRLTPCALVPTQPRRERKRYEAAKPVDVQRLQKLLENYRKAHPYTPPPPPEVPILERTERILSDYCKGLPGGEDADRCYTALDYYEQQRAEAEGGCEVSLQDGHVTETPGCEVQHRLEDFVRNLVGQSPMDKFVETLLVLRSAQAHDQARRARGEAPVTAEDAADERRQRLTALFFALDTDLNGKLDIAEFREGMQRAGQELSGAQVARVLDAMNIDRGYLGLEEFLAIAEVEEHVARSALAQWIRVQSAKDRFPQQALLDRF